MPVVEKTVVVKMTMERKEKRAVLNQSRLCSIIILVLCWFQ